MMSPKMILFASLVVFGQSWVACVDARADAPNPRRDEVDSKSEFAQELPRPDQPSSVARFRVVLAPAHAKLGETVSLTLHADIDPGWHIAPLELPQESSGFATVIEASTEGLASLDDRFTASKEPVVHQVGDTALHSLDGAFTWSRRYRVTAASGVYAVTGKVQFQACNDHVCHPPKTLDFQLGELSVSEPGDQPSPTPAASVGEKTTGEPIVLEFEPSNLTRVRPQFGNLASLILFGRGTDQMVWKATIPSGPVAGVNLYLPKARKYSLVNTGSSSSRVDNTATYISIDQDGNGELAEWEALAVNLPIRIHDTMWRVLDIDATSKTLKLQQVDAPLHGSLVGRKCPEFQFTTLDGKVVSNESIRGTVTVLDIWAVTCHNCYEGFPHLQRMREKHSPERLNVVLLSTDQDREFYDSHAPKLFETYGGGDWPQILIPGGFEGAMILGNYGFGSVVVDEQGIVRAVGMHSFEIESVLDRVLSEKAASGE